MEVLLSANKAYYVRLGGNLSVLSCMRVRSFSKPWRRPCRSPERTDDFSDPGAGAKRILPADLPKKVAFAPKRGSSGQLLYYIGPSQ